MITYPPRAMQFSIFPSSPWAFDLFPLAGDGGEKHGPGAPPAFTPTLTLPRRGGGKRRTGAEPENCMTLCSPTSSCIPQDDIPYSLPQETPIHVAML